MSQRAKAIRPTESATMRAARRIAAKRELVEDVFDLALIGCSAAYYLVVDATGWSLSPTSTAAIAASGATARALLRRILIRLFVPEDVEVDGSLRQTPKEPEGVPSISGAAMRRTQGDDEA